MKLSLAQMDTALQALEAEASRLTTIARSYDPDERARLLEDAGAMDALADKIRPFVSKAAKRTRIRQLRRELVELERS